MAQNDNWFERNEAFVTFVGHLAAIGQRNALIQQQAESQAILREGIALEQQRRAEKTRQEECKNLLYDINQAAEVISSEYPHRPQQAYYQSLLLRDRVAEIRLDHTWFDDLDWKKYCTETQDMVAHLREHGTTSLPASDVAAVEERLRAEKQAEADQRAAALRRAHIAKTRKQEAQRIEARSFTRKGLLVSVASFGIGIIIIYATVDTPARSASAWLCGIAAAGLVPFGALAALVFGWALLSAPAGDATTQESNQSLQPTAGRPDEKL